MSVQSAIKQAMRNKQALAFAKACGCYHCIKLFDVKEIKEYTDQGDTALCPYCNIDAVIPCSDVVELKEANDFWLH